MFALLEAYRAGLFNKANWLNNIVAGVIVGIVALPLAMAFAIASGAKPEQGLYTAIVAGFFVSVLGGSRVQIAGPTGAFIVVLAGITAQYGIEGLQIATLMAGIMLLLLGLAKMGSVIKFIPDPVIVGFTAGIGVIIWVSQWPDFFGLPMVTANHFHEKVWLMLQTLPQLHLATTLLALLGLAIVVFSSRIQWLRRVPGPLIALIVVTVLQVVFQFDGVKTIGSAFGGIPQGLPEFSVPHITWDKVILLMGPAFTIAMLGSIESLLSAVVADSMAGTRHDSNQELVGQGIANIVAPFFGGFAATGAIARTATNVRNGGNSPLAGIVHTITLVLIVLFLAPLAVHIPLAVLAAILFFVAWNMSEIKHFAKMLRRAPRADVTILLITFLLTVFADLVVAVNIGVILAILHFMRRMASSVEVKALTATALQREFAEQGELVLDDSVLVLQVQGPFFFGAVSHFEEKLLEHQNQTKRIIVRLQWVPFIDITGLHALEEAITLWQHRGCEVLLTQANAKVYDKLRKAGVLHQIGPEHYFDQTIDALRLPNSSHTSIG